MNTYILRRKGLGKTSTEAIQSLSTTGIKVFRNDQELPQDADMCIRWGCTSNVPSTTILNKADAIHRVADKAGFRKLLREHQTFDDPLIPRTWLAGETVPSGVPIIVRPHWHAQGKHIQFSELHPDFIVEPTCYASKYIPKVAEYRVFIVSGRVVCVASKSVPDPTQIAWNVAQGGKFENVKWGHWPLDAIRRSLLAFNLSGLDFGGVDVIVDASGVSYILEINSACSLTSPYRQSCFTKAFDYIVTHGKEHFPMPINFNHWQSVIHPAIHNAL